MNLVILALMACSGSDDKNNTTETSDEDYTFVTYNAGLARGFVAGADSRQADLAAGVAAVQADVICLQEVWLSDQVDAVSAATLDAYQHQYWPSASQSDDAGCEEGQLDNVLDCFNENCEGVCTDQVDDCLLANCSLDFAFLPKDCYRCGLANVGLDADGLEENCINNPTEFAYEGGFGTGILSKHPLKSVEEKVFASTTNRRSVLHAVVESPSGDLDVYCTHLTAAFDSIPYAREDGSWIEEQALQIEEMLAFADAATTDHAVMLGDMNTGPAINGFGAEVAENWALFKATDWDFPYLEQNESDVECTYCGDNILVSTSPDDNISRVIDHIMVRGFGGVVGTERILDGADTVAESCEDVFDPSPLSDHFGVAATITW